MFGQNNDSQNQPAQDNSTLGPAPDNSTPPSNFVSPTTPPPPADTGNGAPVIQPTAPDPQAPVNLDGSPDFTVPAPTTAPEPPAPPAVTAPDTPTVDAPTDTPTEAESPAAPATGGGDQLLGMKQEALQHLNPLVQHLDQTPEEKFRTIMMMIQASDDHTKLQEAFEIAKQITDDKARAQALLDVINEINYFTQHQNS